jgi:Siphovirus Gp157
MQNSNGSTGAAVLEGPIATEVATGLTLFQIEESIALLAESAEEAGLTPEIEQALVTYLEGALEKRDRVADFIRYCEWMAELAKAEVKRLQARQKHFEGTAERVSMMVLRVLDFFGVTKLEGRTHTLSKRKCPPSVKLENEARVPARFKRLTVTLPLESWDGLLAAAPESVRNDVTTSVQKREETIDLKAVKDALNLEKEVPGADLVVNQYTLQIR